VLAFHATKVLEIMSLAKFENGRINCKAVLLFLITYILPVFYCYLANQVIHYKIRNEHYLLGVWMPNLKSIIFPNPVTQWLVSFRIPKVLFICN